MSQIDEEALCEYIRLASRAEQSPKYNSRDPGPTNLRQAPMTLGMKLRNQYYLNKEK